VLLLLSGGLLAVISAIVAIVGGSFALERIKKAKILLIISTVLALLAAVMGFTDGIIYGIMYGVAAFLVHRDSGQRLNNTKINQYFTAINETIFSIFDLIKNKLAAKTETPQPVQRTVRQNAASVTPNNPAVSVQDLSKEGFELLKASDFKQAQRNFDRIILRNPKYSTAYLGKLMSLLRVKNANELVALPINLEDEELFQQALECASPKTLETLKKYISVNKLKNSQRIKK